MRRGGPAIPEINIRARSEQVDQMAVADTASVWANFSRGFSQTAANLNQMAGQVAQREGEAEGLAQELDPEFVKRPDSSIRNRAFNRAAMRKVGTETQTRLIEGIAGLAEAHPEDPNAFQEGLKALKAEYVDKLPPELRTDMEQSFARQRLPYERQYARRAQAQLADNALAEAIPAIDAQEKGIGRLAYQGGLDDLSNAAIEGELSSFLVTLSEFGPKGEFQVAGRTFEADPDRGGVLTAADIQTRLLGAGEAVALNRVKGAFDRLETPVARADFAEGFKSDFSGDGEITGNLDLGTVEQLERYFGQAIGEDVRAAKAREVEARALQREQAAIVRSRVSDYRAFASNGLQPNQQEISELRKQATALGEAGLVADLDQIQRTADIVEDAGKQSPAALQAEINAIRGAASQSDGLTPEQASVVSALEAGTRRTVEGLSRDPVGFAVQNGVANEVPFDLLPPEEGDTQQSLVARQENLQARIARAQAIEGRYGVRAGLFNQAETEHLARVETETPGQLAGVAAEIVGVAGPEAPRFLAEVSSDAPMLADLGALLHFGGNPKTVSDASIGLQLRRDNPGVAKGFSGADASVEIQRVLAPLAQLPADQARTQRTAEAIYLGRVGLNQDYDPEQMERALQEATGARFVGPKNEQFGGRVKVDLPGFGGGRGEIIAPSWLKANAVGDVVGSLTPDDYRHAGGIPRGLNGDEMPLRDLRRAELETVGHGRYVLRTGTRNGLPVYAAGDGIDGRYVLDLENLHDRIATRLPEAVGR